MFCSKSDWNCNFPGELAFSPQYCIALFDHSKTFSKHCNSDPDIDTLGACSHAYRCHLIPVCPWVRKGFRGSERNVLWIGSLLAWLTPSLWCFAGTVQKQDGASKHQQNSFYSTFHNSLHMRPLSKEEYKATAITEKAVDDLIESPEFKEWAHSAAANYRISIAPNEKRDEREEDEIEQTADMESHDYLPGKHSVNRRSLNQT